MREAKNMVKWFMGLALGIILLAGWNPKQVLAATYTEVTVSEEALAENASKAIQSALDTAHENATESNPYKVIIPDGDYVITDNLHIYSNTWLYMEDVTLTKDTSYDGTMIITGAIDTVEDDGYGYDEYENIIIEGGYWNNNGNCHSIFRAAHASNLTLKNLTFTYSRDAHLMEVAGVNGLSISGCTFSDQSLSSSSELYYEAIQIDILENYHFQGYLAEDLPTKNVSIDNCTFSDVVRGVGSHTAVLNNPVDTVSITNCTFTDCSSAAIHGMNWINVTISNNTISGVPRGIAIYSVREVGTYLASTLVGEGAPTTSTSSSYQAPATDQNIVITGNTITCNGSDDPYASYEKMAIAVYGYSTSSSEDAGADGDLHGDTVPSGNYYISGVTVSDNTITTIGHGIRLSDTRNAAVSNNTITCKTSSESYDCYGIQLKSASTDNVITGNTIKNSDSNGIYLYGSSSATEISSNTITSAGKYGIGLDSSTATTIKSNTITSPVNYGIFLYNGSTSKTVSSNVIKTAKKDAIRVDGSKVTSSITSNTITSPSASGIYVYNSATVATISSNTISSAGKYGIGVDGSTATTIKSNTITSSANYSIFLYNGSTSKTVSSNVIKTAKTDAIRVDGSKVTSSITNNTITSPSASGIYVYNSATVATISSNTISSAGKYGIGVDGSTATTIKSNTITSSANYGLFLNNGSTSKTVSSNTIKTAKKDAIRVDGSKVTSSITSNTITSPSVSGIYIYNSATVATISSNKVTSAGKYGIAVDKSTVTTIKSNTISKPTNYGIFTQNSAKVTTISSNTVTSGKARGIFIYSTKCNLTISSNTVSKCTKDAQIYVYPGTTSYTVTIKSNTITGTSSTVGIYASKCKVSISSNTIKSAKKAIQLTTTVKGTVYKNTLSSNTSNKLTYGSKTYSMLSTPSSVKATKKSSTSITVSWKKVSNADGYYIYRSTSKSGTYSKVKTITSGSTVSYTNTKLTKGKTYYYKVVAYTKTSNGNVIIRSNYSSIVSKKL